MTEEPANPSPSSAPIATDLTTRGQLARPLLSFLGCGIVVWILFYAAWWSLPGVAPGHHQIHRAAIEAVRSGPLFREGAEFRLVIFGNSQVQAGFIPDVFDEASGGRVSSYNLGLPATTSFVDQLEILVERDPPPTHILMTRPWEDASSSSPRSAGGFMDDSWMMEQLFPFKTLPRDLFLFLVRSIPRGGPIAFYRDSIATVAQSRADRGYYFIAGMSHFPGHRLPDDFGIDSDNPTQPNRRTYRTEGVNFERIRAAAIDRGIELYYVPVMIRIGQNSESRRDEEGVARMAKQGIQVLGPDYWLLHNRNFSDPAHLNQDGARCFTTNLWQLVGPMVLRPAGSAVEEFLSPIKTMLSCK